METTPASDVEERLAAAEAALEEALRERNRLWEELTQTQADRRELEDLRAELRVLRGSRVWQLAGLLQRAKGLALAVLERLRRR
jgi:hypothetical protein